MLPSVDIRRQKGVGSVRERSFPSRSDGRASRWDRTEQHPGGRRRDVTNAGKSRACSVITARFALGTWEQLTTQHKPQEVLMPLQTLIANALLSCSVHGGQRQQTRRSKAPGHWQAHAVPPEKTWPVYSVLYGVKQLKGSEKQLLFRTRQTSERSTNPAGEATSPFIKKTL